ncbi:putative ribonuclease H-like domain-containing protein [Tanacetum coccineum]|uniref:Ribonuclease H-like domain-containing protein n=1 Tax=Tanacetum coccineum TaxID=301880 RepID=A0ABQ5HLW3_9ASTR
MVFDDNCYVMLYVPLYLLRSVNTGRPFSTHRQNVNTSRQRFNTGRARGFNAVKPSEKGIKREYSVARTPQQNGVAERKNRTLIEAARIMLADSKLPTTFWAEAVSTACYVQNRATLISGQFDGKCDLKNKPMIEGNGPKWHVFDLDSLTQLMNYVPVVAGTFSNDFAGVKKEFLSLLHLLKQDHGLYCYNDENGCYQNKSHGRGGDCKALEDNGTADQQVNTARLEVNTNSRDVSTAVPEVNTATPEDLVGHSHASEDSQVEFQGIELGNIPQSYAVPPL